MPRGMRPRPRCATLRPEQDTPRGPWLLSVCVGGTSHRHRKPEAQSCTAGGLRVRTSGGGARRCGFLCGVFICARERHSGNVWDRSSGEGCGTEAPTPFHQTQLARRHRTPRPDPEPPLAVPQDRQPRENPTCGHPPADLNLPHRPTPPDHPVPSLRGPEPASPGSPQATPPQQHGAGDCPGGGVGRGLQRARAAKKAGGEEILNKAKLRAAGCGM